MTADSSKILAGIGNASLAYFAPQDTAGPAAVAYTAETQTLTITGTATAINLTWSGLTAPSQTGSVSTAALATALNTAWASLLGAGTITVTGTAGTSYVLVFPASLGNVPMISVAAPGATSAVMVETTPGAGGSAASAPIPVAFSDAGWCNTSGLVANVNESSTKVTGYGTTQTLRVIISASERSFDLSFLETNATSVAVYNRAPIGSIAPATDGSFTQLIGAPINTTYAGVFDVADGSNHLRVYCPRLQVSTIKARTVSAGAPIEYGVTLTALPDTTGTSVYEYYAVNALRH